MIYTSYFAHYKGDDGVAICLWLPSWSTNIKHYPELAPTQDILLKWKNSAQSKLDERDYIETYKKEVLGKLDVNKVAKDLDGKVLLCYEKTGKFCHRNIVRDWFIENGYECKELD